MAETEIIAHRGASYDAPENTMASIELAWQQNADALEIDIHLSSDGEVVVMHDKTTARTTGFEGEVANLTLADLKALDAGSWKDSHFAGTKIPTLNGVLAVQPLEKRLVIEIKAGKRVIEPLQRCLQKSEVDPDQLVIIGFDYGLMKAVKLAFPHIAALWLRGDVLKDADDKNYSAILEENIASCRAAGLDGLNLHFNWLADVEHISRIHDAGLKSYVWTVNDEEIASRLARAGVNGITTDRPSWIRQRMGQSVLEA